MYIGEIDEEQRSEILWALMERRKDLEKLVADSMKAHAPNKAAEKLLRLYQDGERVDRAAGKRVVVPGLLALFANEPEVSTDGKREREKGFDRKADGQQDAFGGGSEQGGGIPAGGREFLDRYGNSHPTAEAAAAANELPDPAIDRGGLGAEPTEGPAKSESTGDGTEASDSTAPARHLALVQGDGTETIGEPVTEYEIVDESPVGQAANDVTGYDAEHRCIECRVFRGEAHEPTCSIGRAEREAPFDEETAAQREHLAQAAAGAQPSGAPARQPDYSTSAPGPDSGL